MNKNHRKKISARRTVNPDGNFNVVRKGVSKFDWGDLYHALLTLSWIKLFAVVAAGYVITNVLFAFLYLAAGDGVENMRQGDFSDAFFFSVQTMATIGYGAMYPKTLFANILVAIEALLGLLGVSMGSGLVFARFSLPKARVMFSSVAVIAPYNGVPTLMFRVANERQSWILEAQVNVSLLTSEITQEGQTMRRFYNLPLFRDRSSLFALTWTVMHPINENSPLYDITLDKMLGEEMEILITLTGIDQTVSENIHAHHSYIPTEIFWNHQFVDILTKTQDGRRSVDYNRFHDTTPLEN
ncbi:MAG: ATP-sensitive inward rectifier potassium channel 10 [Richelia sp. RM2_1_2]|nr:ATP-sensitive inward rectifier potassium channel 10 [Richelia sp. SM1_7_0]NJN11655.1 ATP-sensitive inward rectifier potassium channel 10 [Richelia sp. RM1_1_1]NJO29921.1 ATP-sensitive inward rectifier potassium channel 10 [Richelia sp. SL_2_1]NJO62427.1 ATP-sensitive inward rectifier potassium channel 10 [Richelia sp. RM2_1_2]